MFKGKGKLSHLTRVELKHGNPQFGTWDEEDLRIWCGYGIVPMISHTYMFLINGKDI